MRSLALVAVLVGSAFAIPAKLDHLEPRRRSDGDHEHHHHHHDSHGAHDHHHGSQGYNYDPPPTPDTSYLPPPTTTTTTTTTTTPPPPPPDAYLPPPVDPVGYPSDPVPTVVHTKMLMPYQFRYDIADEESGNQFHHIEDSDGQYVTGEYSVLLPDGRTQLVQFTSDPENGYQAEVTYQ